jgi:hypothetical protein
MQNVPGATFNACFYTLLSKLWPSGEIPSNIIEDDDTARLFLDKTFDAIAFLSKITVPEAYRSLYMKSYKDSFGAFLYIELPDCKMDSDAKIIVMMRASNENKFYTVEKFGNELKMFEYTKSSKSGTGFMIEDYSDALELYSFYSGGSNNLTS